MNDKITLAQLEAVKIEQRLFNASGAAGYKWLDVVVDLKATYPQVSFVVVFNYSGAPYDRRWTYATKAEAVDEYNEIDVDQL